MKEIVLFLYFPRRYLIKNPTFMCVTAVTAIELALAAGFSTFMPKYISNQFAQSGSWAAILTGKLVKNEKDTVRKYEERYSIKTYC